jgi:hypothetical protein
MDDNNIAVVYDRARSESLVAQPPARCRDRMARHGVDFTVERLVRIDVA